MCVCVYNHVYIYIYKYINIQYTYTDIIRHTYIIFTTVRPKKKVKKFFLAPNMSLMNDECLWQRLNLLPG